MGVYKWISRYVGLMQKYLEKIKPNVSDVWRTDELYLKVKGNNKYLFALMDDETRFWIEQQVADKKNTSDIRPLFREGKEIAGKKPNRLALTKDLSFIPIYTDDPEVIFYQNEDRSLVKLRSYETV
jgi:hypothetical protein